MLEAPEGRGTRPTTDRTRESIASMILSSFDLDLSSVDVLDAFAGSGAIGFELLSRGARSCTFVERDRKASAIVRGNAKALGASPAQARVQVGDVCSLAARGAVQGGPFSLVVLDPPYAMSARDVGSLVMDLRDNGQLASNARVLYEHAAGAGELEIDGSRVIKSKSRGTTAVTLLQMGE